MKNTWIKREDGKEHWTVSDGERIYRCDNKDDAKWLMDLLNMIERLVEQREDA